MPIELKTKSIYLSQGSAKLRFSAPIMQHVVGLAGFSLQFDGGDGASYSVLEIGAFIESQQLDNELQVNVTGILSDGGAHMADLEQSWVAFSVVALTGSDSGDLVLANTGTIASGTQSAPITVGGPPQYLLTAFLSGFYVNYGSPHYLLQLNAGVAPLATGNQVAVEGKAQMYDSSGHNATTAEVSAGIISTTVQDSGLLMQALGHQQRESNQLTVNFGSQVPAGDSLMSTAPGFMSGFQCTYPNNDDQEVFDVQTCVGTGSGASPRIKGNEVEYDWVLAYLEGNGVQTDNSESWVDMLSVAGLVTNE